MTHETVSVREAIAKGQRMVNYPALALMLGIPIAAFFLIKFYGLPMWLNVLSLPLGIALAWWYWSVKITEWRLWAFANVAHVHELRQSAVEARLIWPEGSFGEKTEIRNAEQQAQWEELSQKFDQAEPLYADDPTVPSETLVYFSKSEAYSMMVFGLLLVGAGVTLLIMKERQILGLVVGGIGGALLYPAYKRLTNRSPQLILSDRGIETADTPFYTWSQIQGEDVILHDGKHAWYELVYIHPAGELSMSLEGLDVTGEEVEDLLHIYRSRHERKRKQARSS